MKISQIIVASICIILFAISISTISANRQLHQQVTAQKQFIEQREALIDSLHAEMFILSTQMGRVELSLGHLNQVNPTAFREFSRFYDHETE